jgi:hypothetical protein
MVFTDAARGSRTDNPGLSEALRYLRSRDTPSLCGGWTGLAAPSTTSSKRFEMQEGGVHRPHS